MIDLRITWVFILAILLAMYLMGMYIYVKFIKKEFRIVITGEEQSGKSVLFNKLLFNRFYTTYTSAENETICLHRDTFVTKFTQIKECWISNLKSVTELVLSSIRFRNRHSEHLRANNSLILYLIDESNIQEACLNLFTLIQENVPITVESTNTNDKLRLIVCLSKRDINMSLGRVRRLKNNLNKNLDSAILQNTQKTILSNYIEKLPIIEISAKEESNVELFKRILFRLNN